MFNCDKKAFLYDASKCIHAIKTVLICGNLLLANESFSMNRAVDTDYTFVNKLKGYCVEVREPLKKLKKLEKEGTFKLFFRKIETNEEETNPVGEEEDEKEACFAGLVRQIGNKVIIAFPGTRTDQQAATLYKDLETDLSALPNCSAGNFSMSLGYTEHIAHEGFAKEVAEFWTDLEKCIGECQSYNEIFFTGHSKGGAIALLSALKFSHSRGLSRDSNFVKVFTFAAPPALRKGSGVTLFNNHIGKGNAVGIRKCIDLIPHSSKPVGCVHVGIQEDISVETDAPAQTLAESIYDNVIGRDRNSSLPSAIMRVILDAGKTTAGECFKAHLLDGILPEHIKNVMERVNLKYRL